MKYKKKNKTISKKKEENNQQITKVKEKKRKVKGEKREKGRRKYHCIAKWNQLPYQMVDTDFRIMWCLSNNSSWQSEVAWTF